MKLTELVDKLIWLQTQYSGDMDTNVITLDIHNKVLVNETTKREIKIVIENDNFITHFGAN
jgi:hypothetical protein